MFVIVVYVIKNGIPLFVRYYEWISGWTAFSADKNKALTMDNEKADELIKHLRTTAGLKAYKIYYGLVSTIKGLRKEQ